jgi:hypothetical protein
MIPFFFQPIQHGGDIFLFFVLFGLFFLGSSSSADSKSFSIIGLDCTLLYGPAIGSTFSINSIRRSKIIVYL